MGYRARDWETDRDTYIEIYPETYRIHNYNYNYTYASDGALHL
jgi:hypothetical protein